jgi:mannose-6-phosphate isomerase-like protein (cupin superfamily)
MFKIPALEGAIQAEAGQTVFSLRGVPLLKSGATMALAGRAPNLWAHIKVYSSGGENALHQHEREDHCFLVLQGKATFFFGDGTTRQVQAFEGVVLPRKTLYRFEADPGENLVLFRVGGAALNSPGDFDPDLNYPRELLETRTSHSGTTAAGDAAKNGAHSQAVEMLPGEFFPSS